MHEKRRGENREREMPWTALVEAPAGGGASQARSVGACVWAGPAVATGPRVLPAGPAQMRSGWQGQAAAAPAGVCRRRGRKPGRETGGMGARWPGFTQVPAAVGVWPPVPRAPRIFRVLVSLAWSISTARR